MAQIDDILKLAQERGASDLHLSPNTAPMARVNGEIVPLTDQRISRDALQLMLFEIAEPAARVRFEQAKEVGFAYELQGVLRVRCSLYEQLRGIAGAFRLLPAGIPSLDDLGLPRSVGDLVTQPCGLVVVCGPAGSGRSSTLAALVDHVNRRLCCHIVTLEDPIEFKHACHSSLVDQREIGRHTPGLAQGVHAALHEDADVIATGEPQGAEEMEAVWREVARVPVPRELEYLLALRQAGRIPEAIQECETALRLDPGYASAHNNLGNALLDAGRIPEAIDQYREALRLRLGGDSPYARRNPGVVERNAGTGISYLRRAVKFLLSRSHEASTNVNARLFNYSLLTTLKPPTRSRLSA